MTRQDHEAGFKIATGLEHDVSGAKIRVRAGNVVIVGS
jgi:hypothetical protein